VAARILSQRELNRALLARQGLLEKYTGGVPRAVERMGGVQAQYAPSAYVGLWSRLAGFHQDALDRALVRRSVVLATLMRATIHLVSAADFWPLADAIRDRRREWWLRVQTTGLPEATLRAAAATAVEALRAGPLRQAELAAQVDKKARPAIGMLADLVRVPPSGTWGQRRADLYGLAADWLPRRPGDGSDPVQHLVRRYLGAFGPAHRRDIATWAGLNVGDVSQALAAMELRTFRSEDDAELLDLPRAPLPDPGTPAPVRFLPTWDAVLLTHCRRTQVLPERHRASVFTVRNPFSLGTVLVDGQVRATWRPVDGGIEVAELEPLGHADRTAVDEEAERLADFHRECDTA
jgi:uncharacterized protein YcaQ